MATRGLLRGHSRRPLNTMRKILKKKLYGLKVIIDDKFPDPVLVKLADKKAEERAREVDVKILREIAIEVIKRNGINFCPCCLADLPPYSPLKKKNVSTKTLPKRGHR